MIDPATVGLLTAGVRLVTEVVSSYTAHKPTKAAGPPAEAPAAPGGNIEGLVIERTNSIRETTVVKERTLDKEFIERIVREAMTGLDNLIEYSTETIVDELRRGRVRDAIQEVKARAAALRMLVNTSELDSALVIHMLTGALNPLHVSLEKARYVIEDYGDRESWDYCYLVGGAALLAGYNYLGQRPAYLEDELVQHSRDIHCAILDRIAVANVGMGVPIPWSDVPTLLEPGGADALRALYDSTMAEAAANTPEMPFDVVSASVSEVRRSVHQVESIQIIQEMIKQEKAGQSRVGALNALNERLNNLL